MEGKEDRRSEAREKMEGEGGWRGENAFLTHPVDIENATSGLIRPGAILFCYNYFWKARAEDSIPHLTRVAQNFKNKLGEFESRQLVIDIFWNFSSVIGVFREAAKIIDIKFWSPEVHGLFPYSEFGTRAVTIFWHWKNDTTATLSRVPEKILFLVIQSYIGKIITEKTLYSPNLKCFVEAFPVSVSKDDFRVFKILEPFMNLKL
jgi:hypothetical protein